MIQEIIDAIAPRLKDRNLDGCLAGLKTAGDAGILANFSCAGTPLSLRLTSSGPGLVSVEQIGGAPLTQDVPTEQALDAVCARLSGMLADGGTQTAFSVTPDKTAPPLSVGVVTLPLGKNYGGNLQAHALLEVLRQMGHKPALVNRRHTPDGFQETEEEAAEDDKRPLFATYSGIARAIPTHSFVETRITPLTRPFRSTEQLRRNIGKYGFDALISGSDQVWRPRFARATLPDQFMAFLPEEDRTTKRISYAASFGTDAWEYDADQAEEARSLLARFDAVSVREDSGVDLCRDHFGVAARHVLDPTMLLRPDQYRTLFTPPRRDEQGRRLLTYILDRNDDKDQMIRTLSEKLDSTAFSIDGLPFEEPDAETGDKSVEGWLASFSDADFVVTDSFHGVAFSIIFNKPFIAYGNPNRGMARFTSILKLLGLEDRLITRARELNVQLMQRPIDWDAVNARLNAEREASVGFLRAALAGGGDGGGRRARTHSIPAAPSLDASSGSSVAENAAAGPLRATTSKPIKTHPLNVLCTGCGVCVSEARGALEMTWSEDGFLVPRAVHDDVPADAVRVCPFNPAPEKAVETEDALAELFLGDAKNSDGRGGRYESTYIGYSNRFRPTSSSGGMATYVFDKLLERGDVDHLFVVRSDGADGYRYAAFGPGEDIVKTSKTRYFPVSMDQLFEIIDRTKGRIAVSGVACFIKAIRLKQHYHPEYRDRIPFLVGTICGGLKSRMYTDFLAQRAGIEGEYSHPQYRVKDPDSDALDYSFAATDAGEQEHQLRMRSVGDMWGTGLFKSRACDFCTDVLTELADISLGDAWLQDYKGDGLGNSVVITRSPLAEAIVRDGIAAGELTLEEVPMRRIVQSQSGGVNHKHKGLKFRAWMAEYFTDQPVPALRERLFENLSIPDALVQLNRERTRSKSLRYWKEVPDVETFNRRMRPALKSLRSAMASRKDDSTTPLSALMEARRLEAVRRAVPSGRGGGVMMRWLLQKARGRQTGFGLMRAAVLESRTIRVREAGDGV
ncbi:coenzyme F420-reducing hydrogenase subunit beta (plasmid) [Marinibacterium anthonyi]|nr:coenzyme F420-reducing hydrogenase subunit beta [Marinibacterium anthonyi]